MNGDPASNRVRADMELWGVHDDWINCNPTTHTPIIVQQIRRGKHGRSEHRFSWSCPHCGNLLPPFKAITREAVERVRPALDDTSVFFLDRLSRASLMLASEASNRGALVVFEPCSRGNAEYMTEAVRLAHVIKYADDRIASIPGVLAADSAVILEIKTLGDQGLQYRHRLGKGVSDWTQLEAVPALRLADSCGAGDWCTAGLIASVASDGQDGLRRAGKQGIRDALRYGQALAAWNCGFEGARGGMYAVPEQELEIQIKSLLNGETDRNALVSVENAANEVVACPACPPAPNNLRPS